MTGIHEVFQPPLPVGRLWAESKLGGELRGRGGGGAGAEGCGGQTRSEAPCMHIAVPICRHAPEPAQRAGWRPPHWLHPPPDPHPKVCRGTSSRPPRL